MNMTPMGTKITIGLKDPWEFINIVPATGAMMAKRAKKKRALAMASFPINDPKFVGLNLAACSLMALMDWAKTRSSMTACT